MSLRRLDADYKSFFALWRRGDPKARPPRFKGKHYFTTLCYNQPGFKLEVEQRRIRFAHCHPSGIELVFALPWLPPLKGRIKQVERPSTGIKMPRSTSWCGSYCSNPL
jgi:putative transposase